MLLFSGQGTSKKEVASKKKTKKKKKEKTKYLTSGDSMRLRVTSLSSCV